MERARLIGVLLAGMVLGAAAQAETTVRVGKPQAEVFPFVAVDVGIETGIFKKHGLTVENIVFAGGAKLEQGLAADAVDIGLGSGPELAFIVKGAPTLAVAALANAPAVIALPVLKDGPVKSIADLKGRTVSVSTAGSLTDWLAHELVRQQGWKAEDMKIVALGTAQAQVAALKTGQIAGLVTDLGTGYRLEEEGSGRVLLNFGTLVKDFHVYVAFGRRGFLDKNPEATRAFLAAYFESVAFMRADKAKTVEIGGKVIGMSPAITARLYDELMPVMSSDGRFNAKALQVLSRSFVEMDMLATEPDTAKLVSEAYLPGGH